MFQKEGREAPKEEAWLGAVVVAKTTFDQFCFDFKPN